MRINLWVKMDPASARRLISEDKILKQCNQLKQLLEQAHLKQKVKDRWVERGGLLEICEICWLDRCYVTRMQESKPERFPRYVHRLRIRVSSFLRLLIEVFRQIPSTYPAQGVHEHTKIHKIIIKYIKLI